MKILLGFAITLTVFLQFLLAQPTAPVSNESANSKENAVYAYIFKEAKLLSDMIESVIKKALPHIPKSPDNEVYRDQLNEYLQLKREYKEAELKEDCGEKAIKLFEHQTDFFRFYVIGVSSAPAIQEVIQVLNEYGMQKVKEYSVEALKSADTSSEIDEQEINKYVMEHCKPAEAN